MLKPHATKRATVLGFLAVFAVIGVAVTLLTMAAGTPIAFEAETGTLANGATVASVTGQSGTGAVKFAAAAPTPTPGVCQGAPNTPGGADPWGGCFPGAFNTGYPHGLPGDTRPPVTLTSYTGSCTVPAGQTVTIDKKNVDCSSEGLFVYGTLIVTSSYIKGEVYENSNAAVLKLTDTEVDGLSQLTFPTIGGAMNITALRVNSHGGQHTFQCYGNCDVQDSWAHDQTEGGTGPHQNGFLSNGGSNYVLRHNSMFCATTGCTSDIAFTADGNTDNAVIDKNLFVASPGSSYCLDASHSDSKPAIFTRIKITNNIWQKGTKNSISGQYIGTHACATYGPIYGWDPPTTTPGTNGYLNEWSGNKWDDGTVLSP